MWKRRAYGKRRVQGEMNSWERDYASHLENEKHAGRVEWYAYEGIKLRLADRTHYTPDFAVLLADGQLEMHEVKGFWQDDARVKIKVAAEQYPIAFVAITRKRVSDPWTYERF
jgi:hypothetical protein